MTRDVKTIKRDILRKFRSLIIYNRRSLPLIWPDFYRLNSLGQDEQGGFDKAIRDLVANGIIMRIEGEIPELTLTQKGYNLILGR